VINGRRPKYLVGALDVGWPYEQRYVSVGRSIQSPAIDAARS